MNKHPDEASLALMAGGEGGAVSRFLLNRHVRGCGQCTETVAEFRTLRERVSLNSELEPALSELEWNQISAEMRANIHLGLEAGACVGGAPAAKIWNPRLSAAFASLILLIGAGVMMRGPQRNPAVPVAKTSDAVVESTGTGLEVRTGESSMMLLNHHGSVADQTVSAQGAIRASYINAGGVTINNVYLE